MLRWFWWGDERETKGAKIMINLANTLFTSCDRSEKSADRAIEVARSEGFNARKAIYLGNRNDGQLFKINDRNGEFLINVSVHKRYQ